MSVQKTCPKCKTVKPHDEFGKSKARYDGLQSVCTPCKREIDRSYYTQNKPKFQARQTIVRDTVRHHVMAHLWQHPCVDCGEDDPVVLEFDHVRGEKIMAISAMLARRYAWPTVRAEIEKCEVRCANCHRRKSAHDFGYYTIPEWAAGSPV